MAAHGYAFYHGNEGTFGGSGVKDIEQTIGYAPTNCMSIEAESTEWIYRTGLMPKQRFRGGVSGARVTYAPKTGHQKKMCRWTRKLPSRARTGSTAPTGIEV